MLSMRLNLRLNIIAITTLLLGIAFVQESSYATRRGTRQLGQSSITARTVKSTAPNNAGHISQQTLPPPNCKDPQTNRDMIECGSKAFKEADKKLNQVYKTLQARMGEKQKKRLASSQQNWVKFRDSACAFEAGMYESGSLEPPTRISCYGRMTTQRVRDLDTWLQELNSR
jgi:uncharacterized protein YecT (DUF1311 family)